MMFVRFRETQSRLQVSLVEARRTDGTVRHEHVASFGSVPMPPSVDDRLAFWKRLHERLAKLANRIDPATHGKVLGQVHARVPMVVVDEQRDVQLRNAESDEQFWSGIRDMNLANVEEHKALAETVARSITTMQVAADEAAANAATAKERTERIRRGEDIEGGLGKPMTREDYERILRKAGLTDADIAHCKRLHELSELGLMDEVYAETSKAREQSMRAVSRRMLLREIALGHFTPGDD